MTDWHALAQALNRAMTTHAPGWTDRRDHDPGVTILSVLAYLSENLQDDVKLSLREPGPIHRETSAMLAERWSGTKRPNYFSGKRLSVDDFRDEQTYLVEKCRRHLRTLHGSGIVSGLQVEADGAGWSITVAPGLAIDAHGCEIQMNEPATLTIASQTSSPTLVLVEYAERLVDPVPVSPGGSVEASRIEEGCRVTIASAADDDRVAIARLLREQSGWRVDATFAPSRVR